MGWLMCRLGRHKWHRVQNEEGGRYQTCWRCGKDRNEYGPPPPGMAIGGGAW